MNVDLGEGLSTGKLIKQNVNVGQWMFALDGDDIHGPIIYT
jgi:hypothetical protein